MLSKLFYTYDSCQKTITYKIFKIVAVPVIRENRKLFIENRINYLLNYLSIPSIYIGIDDFFYFTTKDKMFCRKKFYCEVCTILFSDIVTNRTGA